MASEISGLGCLATIGTSDSEDTMVEVNICDSPSSKILREPFKVHLLSGCVWFLLGMSGWLVAMDRRDKSHWIHNNAFPGSLSHSLLGDHRHVTLQ